MSDAPPALFERIEAPIFNDIIKKWVGRGELDYEVYLRTPKLLSLQFKASERVAEDELLFQIVHQSQELWLKLIAHELARASLALDAGDPWTVGRLLQRSARIAQCLVDEMAVIETLSPEKYQLIRNHLGDGSGQESPGYNAIRVATDAMNVSLEAVLGARGLTVVDVYRDDTQNDLRAVFEQCLDVDEALQMWLVRHFMLVRRTIGVDTKVRALDGIPTRILAGRMTKPFFPELWDARVELTTSWSREGGTKPAERWAERDAGENESPP